MHVSTALDRLESLAPTDEFLPNQRPYLWEMQEASIPLAHWIQQRGIAPTDLLLCYWQSGASDLGWRWRLGFANAAEAIDFLSVGHATLACTPVDGAEVDLPLSAQKTIAVARKQALCNVKRGQTFRDATRPLLAALAPHLAGEFELCADMNYVLRSPEADASAQRLLWWQAQERWAGAPSWQWANCSKVRAIPRSQVREFCRWLSEDDW